MGSTVAVTDLLGAMVAFLQPKIVVECGTYKGRTATVMAGSMASTGFPSFHIFTAETCPEYADDARKLAEDNMMGEFVTVYTGDASDMLAEIVPPVIDLAYIDGGDRFTLTRTIYDRLSEGGIIVLDDANQYTFTGRLKPTLMFRQGRGLAIFQRQFGNGNDIDFYNHRAFNLDYRKRIRGLE